MLEKAGSSATHPEMKSTSAGFWHWFRTEILMVEQTAVLLKNLTIVGMVGTIIGAYFQYNSWREEHIISEYKENFAKATDAFAESSKALSMAMNLQHIIFFTFKNAVDSNVETQKDSFLVKSSRDVYKAYVEARTTLRGGVNVFARKAEIYIDWPSNKDRDPAKAADPGSDPISLDTLGVYNFRCDRHMPDRSVNALEPLSLPGQGGAAALQVDWRSVKHQLLTFYLCFDRAHSEMLVAREWASESPVDATAKAKFIEGFPHMQAILDRQVERMNALMMLSMRRIEQIRLKYEPTSFLCHLLALKPWCI
jgi:hypothetical protein